MKKKFYQLFGDKKAVIGMIHTQASPGTPKYNGDVKSIIASAVEEAKIYAESGVDSVMIENMHDVPYLNRNVGPEVVSLMSIIGYEVKNNTGLPTGIQILAGANKEALAVANSAGLDFIRAEGFIYSHVADEGIMNSDGGELLRYRKSISADNIQVFTDIKKKHSSHNLTSDVDIVEFAKAAEFFLSDGIIITGKSTSLPVDKEELKNVYEAVDLPVIIGSGITENNLEEFINYADAFIVGSYFKEDGKWFNKIDPKKVDGFMNLFGKLN